MASPHLKEEGIGSRPQSPGLSPEWGDHGAPCGHHPQPPAQPWKCPRNGVLDEMSQSHGHASSGCQVSPTSPSTIMFKQPKLEIHFTIKRANSLLRVTNCLIQVFFFLGHTLVHFQRNVSPLILQENIPFLSYSNIFLFQRPGRAFPQFALPRMKKMDPDPELANGWMCGFQRCLVLILTFSQLVNPIPKLDDLPSMRPPIPKKTQSLPMSLLLRTPTTMGLSQPLHVSPAREKKKKKQPSSFWSTQPFSKNVVSKQTESWGGKDRVAGAL